MPNNTFKVVILDHRYDHYEQEKEVLSEIGAAPIVAYPESKDEARVLLHDADGIICNLYNMDAEIIEMLKKMPGDFSLRCGL